MDRAKLRQLLINAELSLAATEAAVKAAKEELNTPDAPPDIDDCNKLFAALEAGGDVRLISSCSTPGYWKVKGKTNLYGNSSTLHGEQYAIQVPMREHDGIIDNLVLTTAGQDCILNLGSADIEQNELEEVPMNWLLSKIKVSGYSGKRAVAVNAGRVYIRDSSFIGIVHPNNLDSQAVWLGNSPGDLIVENCILEAASECFLAGGDTLKIPGVRKNLKFTNCLFTKNLAWKGVVPVKNIFEIKDADVVTVEKCKLVNCWASAQQGEAFMFTPTRGGQALNIQVIDCTVDNVSSICNITGNDSSGINKARTQVSFNGGLYKTNKLQMGGRGQFALIDRGPEYLKINNCDITIDGSAFIEVTGSLPMDLLEITNSRFNYGTYGIRLGGYNDGDNTKGLVKQIKIEGNTILGSNSRFRARYPNNTYA